VRAETSADVFVGEGQEIICPPERNEAKT